MVNGQNFFNEPVNNDLRAYDKIQKIVIRQEDDYKTGCLLDNPYFKGNYKMIEKDLATSS